MTKENSLLESVTRRIADEDEQTRHDAVRDLLELDVPVAVPLLLDTLGDDSLRIRRAALDIICLMPKQVIFPKDRQPARRLR